MASCRAARRAFGVRLYQTSQGTRRPRQAHCARARADKDEAPDQLSMSCPVPRDQQPMFEMKQLQQDTLFTWAELPLPDFVLRLAAVYLGVFLFIGVPVSAVTFDWAAEPVQFLASASIGSCFVVTVTLLRLYLGWSHVGNRLLSATVEYEETGWYDGQIWVKDPAVLMRDRLLSNYTVKPVMGRIKTSLLTSSAAALLSVVVLNAAPRAPVYEGALPTSTQAVVTRCHLRGCAPWDPDTEGIDPDTYWDNVAKWEPEALEDDDESGAPRGMSVLEHMRGGA